VDIVDSDPGAFGAAWTLASSVQFALAGIERAYHWGTGDRNFANDDGLCSTSISPTKCNLYNGNSWLQATAAKYFGADAGRTTTVLQAPSFEKGATSVSGIAGWSYQNGTGDSEFCSLISVFAPEANQSNPVEVKLQFSLSQLSVTHAVKIKTTVFNRTTSTYDAIYRKAKTHDESSPLDSKWLAHPGSSDIYGLGEMLTTSGRHNIQDMYGADFLATQRSLFDTGEWQSVGSDQVSCSSKTCHLTFIAAPPSVTGTCLTFV